MTVSVADAHVHFRRLVSIVKTATVLEVYTTEEENSLMRFFLWAKGLNAKDIHKEMFSVYGGKCLSRIAVSTGSRNCHLGGNIFADNEDVETDVRKWLRQQPKDFYTAGFDALVKRWDKFVNVAGGYAEK
jgi:hypothetical protein